MSVLVTVLNVAAIVFLCVVFACAMIIMLTNKGDGDDT